MTKLPKNATAAKKGTIIFMIIEVVEMNLLWRGCLEGCVSLEHERIYYNLNISVMLAARAYLEG